MLGPSKAACLLAIRGKIDGLNHLEWAMPDGQRETTLSFTPYPRKYAMDRGGGKLLVDCWDLLDSKVDIIMAEVKGAGDNAIEANNRERAKFEARGVAETIQLLMSFFYSTTDEVVREAVARHKDRLSGTEHSTRGLGEEIWEHAPMRTVGGPTRATRNTVSAKKKSPPGRKLSAAEVQGIKDAVASGLFSPQACAGVFKVSLAQVEEALAS